MVGHGGMQVDIILEKEMRVLYPDLLATGSNCLSGCDLSIYKTAKPTSKVTHFAQQSHRYTSKATFPNSAIPYGQTFKHMTLGAIPIQTTTPVNCNWRRF